MSSKKKHTSVNFDLETYELVLRCKKVETRSASFIVDREVKKNLGSRKDLQEEHADKK